MLKAEQNPAGYLCFNHDEVGTLAKFKIACDLKAKDFTSLQESFKTCMDAPAVPDFFSSRIVLVSVVTAALVTGFLLGRK